MPNARLIKNQEPLPPVDSSIVGEKPEGALPTHHVFDVLQGKRRELESKNYQ